MNDIFNGNPRCIDMCYGQDFGNVGAESSDYNYVGMGQTDGNSKHPTADVD